MRSLETFFGRVLWNSRYLALIAVVASLIGAIVMFVVSGVDAIGIIGAGFRYATSDPNLHHALRGKIVASIAEFVDGFLFALVLIIFALGLYELSSGRSPRRRIRNSPNGCCSSAASTISKAGSRA
jgi:uncharacterized membrane protein YqhA